MSPHGIPPIPQTITVRCGKKWVRVRMPKLALECPCGYCVWDHKDNQNLITQHEQECNA